MREHDVVLINSGPHKNKFGEVMGIEGEDVTIILRDDTSLTTKHNEIEIADTESTSEYLRILLADTRELLSESYAAYDTLNFDFRRIVAMVKEPTEGMIRIINKRNASSEKKEEVNKMM